jgi:hypothetical protein
MNRNNQGAMEQEIGIYKQLGPEGLRQQTNLGTVDERAALAQQQSHQGQQMVQQQLQQMQEMGKPQGGNYHTAGGAILGGLGDAVRSVASAYGSHKLRGQQQEMIDKGAAAQNALLAQKDQGRFDYADKRGKSFQEIVEAMMRQQQGGAMNQPSAGLGLNYGLDPSLFGG